MTSTHQNEPDGQLLDRRAARRAVLGGSAGNFMVFYELFTYGYLAVVIGEVFFPATDPFVAYLAAFAVYGLTYVVRPLGALVLGRLADRRGRRPVLLGTMLVMCAATTLIGVLPSYGQVGVLAPVLLVTLRLVQGFAAAGEFGSAVALMAEFAPKHRRGLYTSWQSFTIGLALLVGSGLATLLASVLTDSQLQTWGWRVPFLLAAVFGAVALHLRRRIDETPSFQRMQRGETSVDTTPFQPLRFPVPTWVLVPFIAGCLVAWTAGGSVFLQVLPSYAIATLGGGNATSQLLTFVGSAAFAATIPLFGWLSDLLGRRVVMLTGAGLIAVLAYPLFLGISAGDIPVAFIGVALAGTAVAMMAGPGPAMMAELFPANVRVTGLGFAYNLQEALFGGAAGLIIGGLRALAGDPIAAAYYPIFAGIVSILCLALLRRTTAPLR